MHRWIWAAVALAVVMTSVSFRAIDAHQDSNAGPVTPLQTDGGRIAGLSPNGARIAVVTYGSSLCIFDAITLEETSCAPLDRLDSDPASDGMVWSPDSTRLAIAEIGLLLGFQDAPAFHHAFKSWQGQGPGQYRSGLSARA